MLLVVEVEHNLVMLEVVDLVVVVTEPKVVMVMMQQVTEVVEAEELVAKVVMVHKVL